jgi:hypothetical protein
LKLFFDFDPDKHKIKIGHKRWDVDILIPQENLVIEFDGEHWHAPKVELDRTKSQSIRDEGWTLIRIREYPLEALHDHDVVVPTRNAKPTADLALLKIEEVLGRPIAGLRAYLEKTEPQNAAAAEQYTAALRKRRAELKKQAHGETRQEPSPGDQLALPGFV